MNEVQTVFSLFFAILWGAEANAQPRWKPFHWPFLRIPETRHRLCLSMVIFNILPIVFFGFSLWALDGKNISAWTPWPTIGVVVFGVLPAFSTFGFYRLWLGIIASNVGYFYPKNDKGEYVTEGSESRVVYFTPETSKSNIATGICYLVFPMILLIIHRVLVI